MSDLESLPPHSSWSFQQVSSESDLLRVCALTCNQVLVNRAEPVISHNWLSSSGELAGPQSQKSGQSVNLGWGWRWWWRWWWCVVVVVVLVLEKLSHHLHHLCLGCYQLLHGVVVVVVGIVVVVAIVAIVGSTGRHLGVVA